MMIRDSALSAKRLSLLRTLRDTITAHYAARYLIPWVCLLDRPCGTDTEEWDAKENTAETNQGMADAAEYSVRRQADEVGQPVQVGKTR